MKRGFKNVRKRKFKRLFIITLIITTVIILILDSQLRPMIKRMAEVRAAMIATTVINKAISELIAKENITYDTIVKIKYDGSDQVTAIESNISAINKLKADISNAANIAITEYEENAVTIPIGTLTGNEFLIGRGPKIPIKFTLASVVNSNLSSEFFAAGINQTCSRIMLNIETRIYVLIPWYNTSTKVDTNFCIAETIIVGKVPNTFASIDIPSNKASGLLAGNSLLQQETIKGN